MTRKSFDKIDVEIDELKEQIYNNIKEISNAN